MSEPVPLRYRAFLSYSHRDRVWGKWLHAALESYRIDKDLTGRETPAGSVPKTLRPIFRDREDFSAGHSLSEQTLAALEASQFLIVICSPSAAQSKYVNEEVRRFKMLGRAQRVIPVIVEGQPGDPARECFPPALRFKVGANGQITDEREEPIAADARAEGDGKEIAKQKVVAGLVGLGLDEIVRARNAHADDATVSGQPLQVFFWCLQSQPAAARSMPGGNSRQTRHFSMPRSSARLRSLTKPLPKRRNTVYRAPRRSRFRRPIVLSRAT